jgi:hypothetical protein
MKTFFVKYANGTTEYTIADSIEEAIQNAPVEVLMVRRVLRVSKKKKEQPSV